MYTEGHVKDTKGVKLLNHFMQWESLYSSCEMFACILYAKTLNETRQPQSQADQHPHLLEIKNLNFRSGTCLQTCSFWFFSTYDSPTSGFHAPPSPLHFSSVHRSAMETGHVFLDFDGNICILLIIYLECFCQAVSIPICATSKC